MLIFYKDKCIENQQYTLFISTPKLYSTKF